MDPAFVTYRPITQILTSYSHSPTFPIPFSGDVKLH